MARLIPLGEYSLVRRDEKQAKVGGIFIPDRSQEKPITGVVIAVGPGKKDAKGNTTVFHHKVGDHVYVGRHSGIEVEFEGEKLLLVPPDKIFAKIEK